MRLCKHWAVPIDARGDLAHAVITAGGVPVREVEPKELHLLMTAYTNAMFEVVVHDFTKQEARHYLDTLHRFFVPGWRALLGL